LLNRAEPNPQALETVKSAVDSFSFQDFAVLPEKELLALLPSLRSVALALLTEIDVDKRAIEALWTQRIVRLGLVFALLVVSAFAISKFRDTTEKTHDLAAGKPWRSSSQYSGVSACASPEQECTQSPDFFFHTVEELRPWLEIDLGSAQTFSAVRVENRRDCCMERAVPMVVEVSSDQKHWRTIARRDAVFSSWLAKFAPVSARYVRVRLEKRESLHLQRVRVLP